MLPEKRYEILESLPVYGPMYIPVPENAYTPYSEGYVVRFYKDDGSDWVANFESGWGRLNTVIELLGQVNLLIIAYGTCYVMNPNSTKPLEIFGTSYNKLLHSAEDKLILYGNNDISIVDSDGSHKMLDIYFDGIKDVLVEGNILKGFTSDYTDIWTPFEYNLDTKELTVIGGNWTYHTENTSAQLPKKLWWKFW